MIREVSRPDELLSTLGDDLSRKILAMVSARPMTADDIVSRCDVSGRTVYRRLDSLLKHDLVDKQTTLGEDGHQHSRYSSSVDEIDVDFSPAEDDLTVEVSYSDDVDRFIGLFQTLQSESADMSNRD